MPYQEHNQKLITIAHYKLLFIWCTQEELNGRHSNIPLT